MTPPGDAKVAGAAGFRTKLMVAMMLVILAITAVALFVVERRAGEDVRDNLQREFRREFSSLLGARRVRFAAIADRCRTLAGSVRIRAALEEGDVRDLYANGEIELRGLLAHGAGDDANPHLPRAEFFRFLDADGAVLRPREDDGAVENQEWEQQLAMRSIPLNQQSGYIFKTSDDGSDSLIEIISTPIIATDTGEIIGAVLLGFAAEELDVRLARGGIWLSKPDAARTPLGSAVATAIGSGAAGSGGFQVELEGAPYFVFFQALNPKAHFAPGYQVSVYPLAELLAQQRRLRWQIVGGGALILVFALIVTHLVSGRLSAPIEKLAVDSAENRARRKQAEAALEVSNEELRAMNGELQRALAELRAAQQQVIQQERLRALGQMASGIAHDFNNALVPILGFCELLLLSPATMGDRAKAAKYLETIQTAAKDAASVVSRLREFYRPDKGRNEFTPVNLKRLVEQVITLTKPKWKDQAQANGATIQIALELEAVPPVAGEESALREVLTNLIFNAVDAMPRGGTITLRTWRKGDSAAIEVADTGTGMSEEVRKHCLEPFYSTKGERGTGLGLSMVFGIVQRHSGALDLRSEVGKGTTFTITLPLQDAVTLSNAEAPARKVPRSLRVLVVDDEAPVRDTLAAVLGADGHEVEMAVDGNAGLARFGEGRFDLVVTDKAMPGMNGDQMAAAIKRLSPKMPIVLLTGFGLFHDKKEFPDVDVLASKPIRIPVLREAIATAMQLS